MCMNWKFLVKRFDPDKPLEEHEIIDTYLSIEGARRRANNEEAFCYVEPVNISNNRSSTSAKF